jgi:DNA-binding transcriptional MerR regulator
MPDYSMSELASLTGLPPRTIRYYVAEGLVRSPGREGAATRYPESTLARLRLIAKLRDARLPLAEIRSRLAGVTDEQVVELSAQALTPPVVSESALDYIRGVLAERPPLMAADVIAFYGAAPPATAASTGLPPGPPSAAAAPMPAQMGGPAVEARFREARFLHRQAAFNPNMPSAGVQPPAETSERSEWERIELGDGIELHVRRPPNSRQNRMVERLLALARQLQKEDAP